MARCERDKAIQFLLKLLLTRARGSRRLKKRSCSRGTLGRRFVNALKLGNPENQHCSPQKPRTRIPNSYDVTNSRYRRITKINETITPSSLGGSLARPPASQRSHRPIAFFRRWVLLHTKPDAELFGFLGHRFGGLEPRVNG